MLTQGLIIHMIHTITNRYIKLTYQINMYISYVTKFMNGMQDEP